MMRCHRCRRAAAVRYDGRLWCALHSNILGDVPARSWAVLEASRHFTPPGRGRDLGRAIMSASVLMVSPPLLPLGVA